jgi:Sec-independent protein translocase protein TatA
MQQIGFPEVVLICTVAVLLCWGNKVPELALMLNEALTKFRGGPGSPSHPIPADDSRLLNRKIGDPDEKSDKASRR